MPPEVQSLIGWDKFHREGITSLAQHLPAEDELWLSWMEKAAREHDIYGFVSLLYAALIGGRPVPARVLVLGFPFLPTEMESMAVAMKLTGNVAAALVEAAERGGLAPGREVQGLLVAALWCQERKEPLPEAIIPRTRVLARQHWKAEGVPLHAQCISMLTGDAALKAIVLEQFPGTTEQQRASIEGKAKAFLESYRKVGAVPILDFVPATVQRTTRVLAQGKTLRRAVERIGRNEPCHCGSGKKYKHCCIEKDNERLHRSTHVAGKTREELEANPEAPTTEEGFLKLPFHQLARLDPLKVRPELVHAFILMLAVRGMDEVCVSALKTLQGKVSEEQLYGAWYNALYWTAKECRPKAIRELMAFPTLPELLAKEHRTLSLGVELLLKDDEPAALLAGLESQAKALLDEPDDERLSSFAMWLMFNRRFGALGVMVARGVIPLVGEKDSAFLLRQILEVRDKLNLPADDAASDIVDKQLLKKRDAEEDDEGHTGTALRKAARTLEKKGAEVRSLKEEKARLERELDLLLRKQARVEAEQRVTEPTEEDKNEIARLRAALEQADAHSKQAHRERNESRRELEATRAEMEKLRNEKSSNSNVEVDREDTLLLPPDAACQQPVRLLEFPKKFEETLRSVPRHIARNTMVTLGQIAAGEPAGFAGARRLQACADITRQRIGSDYRLLFRLLPDRVQVVTLINRRDLERTIKTFV